jgi:hypothetical protein
MTVGELRRALRHHAESATVIVAYRDDTGVPYTSPAGKIECNSPGQGRPCRSLTITVVDDD